MQFFHTYPQSTFIRHQKNKRLSMSLKFALPNCHYNSSVSSFTGSRTKTAKPWIKRQIVRAARKSSCRRQAVCCWIRLLRHLLGNYYLSFDEHLNVAACGDLKRCYFFLSWNHGMSVENSGIKRKKVRLKDFL